MKTEYLGIRKIIWEDNLPDNHYTDFIFTLYLPLLVVIPSIFFRGENLLIAYMVLVFASFLILPFCYYLGEECNIAFYGTISAIKCRRGVKKELGKGYYSSEILDTLNSNARRLIDDFHHQRQKTTEERIALLNRYERTLSDGTQDLSETSKKIQEAIRLSRAKLVSIKEQRAYDLERWNKTMLELYEASALSEIGERTQKTGNFRIPILLSDSEREFTTEEKKKAIEEIEAFLKAG